MPATAAESEAAARTLGIAHPGRVSFNLSSAALVEEAVRRGEGVLTDLGAFSALTGSRTGRSPKDKFTVREEPLAGQIDWTANQPMEPARFNRLRDLIRSYLQNRDLYIFDGHACADARKRVDLRVVTEKAWHSLFARCLFIRPSAEELAGFQPDWTILHAADFHADPTRDGTNSNAVVAISFDQRLVLACGTHYAGEIKKAAFTVLNALLPQKGVFPMHCAANVGTAGDVALFFGLSGTGKTTLSADPERRLIGDDEHGWSDDGVFNIEGGCYAKTIKLSATGEPQIYNALRFGCVLENVPVDPLTRKPDFNIQQYTENTRAAYPVDFIPNCELSGVGGHLFKPHVKVEQPMLDERATVQVKSRASQAVLDDHIERYRRSGAARTFFVCHSPDGVLSSAADDARVHVWTGDRLAELAVKSGLYDWLIERVG